MSVQKVVTWGLGLGDALMFGSAMGACWDRDNDTRFIVYAASFHETLENLPWIMAVRKYDGQSVDALRIDMSCERADSEEGLVATSYHLFGLGDIPREERRLRYIVTEQETEEAKSILGSIGWRGEPLIVLQVHGGWIVKRWPGFNALAKQLRKEGFFVASVGMSNHINRQGYYAPDGPGSLLNRLSVRQLAAVHSLASCYVGFESGGSYLAAAVGAPTVWLCGPHNPIGLLGALGGHDGTWIALRADWIAKCGRERGLTCREGFGYPHRGVGEMCPHRKWGNFGADCIDSISVEQVMKCVREMVTCR
jgi:Glycosyltransferase family 9 (heptosyltransferase)